MGDCGIGAEHIQILPAFLLQGVAAEPTAELGEIVAVAIVVEASLRIKILRREAVAEHVGHRAGLRYRPAEGIISVLSHDDAIRVPIPHDVSEGVLELNVDRAVALLVEQSADAASALEGTGQILAPDILNDVGLCAAHLYLPNEVPAIVEEVCCRRGCCLLHSSPEIVVGVGGDLHAV